MMVRVFNFIIFLLCITISGCKDDTNNKEVFLINEYKGPCEIRISLQDHNYNIKIVGKDNILGALVTNNSVSYNVRLLSKDLYVLSQIQPGDIDSSDHLVNLEIKYDTHDSGFENLTVARDSDFAMLIEKIIDIYNLPEYKVKHGDTLSKVMSQEFNNRFTTSQILEVNPDLDPDSIRVGLRIKIPQL